MNGFDLAELSAVRNARPDAVPEMVRRTLRVLEDLMEDADHTCTFTLVDCPIIDDDLTAAVNTLLPNGCRVARLEPVTSVAQQVRSALPAFFVPINQADAWVERAAARELAEALADWVVALMRRLWPDSAEAWALTVYTTTWYEADYVDLVVRGDERIWLLHLGVSD